MNEFILIFMENQVWAFWDFLVKKETQKTLFSPMYREFQNTYFWLKLSSEKIWNLVKEKVRNKQLG